MNDMFQGFIKHLKSTGKDQKTIDSYILNINLLLRYLKEYKTIDINSLEEFELLVTEDFKDYIIYLQHRPSQRNKEGNKPATINLKLTAIRQLYSFLVTSNIIQSNPMLGVECLEIPEEESEFLTVDEALQLIKATEQRESMNDCNKFRDALIIKMFLYCGLRLSELAELKVNDLNNKDTIRICGKRKKVRYLALNQDIEDSFEKYMKYRKENNINNEFLFVSSKGVKVCTRTIQNVVIKYAKLARLEKKIHAHTLRHGYASMTAQTVSSLELMRLMGHSRITTTEIYYHMDAERSKEIANKNPLLQKVKGF